MFVGNLPNEVTEQEVKDLFSQYGTVRGISLAMEVFSGKCRGFGFVDMEGHEARAAIAGLNGSSFKDRMLKVNEERPKPKGRGRGRGRR
jgi:RNA recognition motif-containing protein